MYVIAKIAQKINGLYISDIKCLTFYLCETIITFEFYKFNFRTVVTTHFKVAQPICFAIESWWVLLNRQTTSVTVSNWLLNWTQTLTITICLCQPDVTLLRAGPQQTISPSPATRFGRLVNGAHYAWFVL